MEQTECSEMLARKIHTPRNYPEESIQLFKCLLFIKMVFKTERTPQLTSDSLFILHF